MVGQDGETQSYRIKMLLTKSMAVVRGAASMSKAGYEKAMEETYYKKDGAAVNRLSLLILVSVMPPTDSELNIVEHGLGPVYSSKCFRLHCPFDVT